MNPHVFNFDPTNNDHVLAERIFSDINAILDRFHPNQGGDLLTEFNILPTPDHNHCNRSPVILENDKLGLESWCLRLLFGFLHSRLISNKDVWFNDAQFRLLSNYSRMLVLLNPDHMTAWNVRRRLVSENYLEPSDELALSDLAMTKKPKSDDVFTYRQWIIDYMRKFRFQQLNDQFIENEFRFCSKACDRYSRNYYAWTYATWLMENFCRHRPDIVERELEHSKEWIERHISDYSCYHYRQLLLVCHHGLFRETLQLAPSSSYKLKDELDWLDDLIKTFPIRESILLHRRFILSGLKSCPGDGPEWRSVIDRETVFLDQLKKKASELGDDDVSKLIYTRYIEHCV